MNRSVIDLVRGIGWHPLKQLHAFLYGRFTPRYLWAIEKLLAHSPQRAKEHLANTYHGKVMTPQDASRLVAHGHDIEARGLDKVVPYKYAKDLILKNPQNITLYNCPCRSLRQNPCLPRDVCIIIGDPFAGAAEWAHPAETRRIAPEEALSVLQAEHERGHIHAAYFKDTMLDRFYAICNCCKCCCTEMRVLLKYSVPILAPSGYVAEVSDACDGCGCCAEFCQFEAIEVGEKAQVVYDRCFGCGVCESRCPLGAISLRRDPGKGEPLDIRSLTVEERGEPSLTLGQQAVLK